MHTTAFYKVETSLAVYTGAEPNALAYVDEQAYSTNIHATIYSKHAEDTIAVILKHF
jgi:hypothetical protein